MVGQNVQLEKLFHESTSEMIKALNDLFERPWWDRVWVAQELAVAKQLAAKATCGNTSVPWIDLLVSAYAIDAFWGILSDLLRLSYPDDNLNGYYNGLRMAQCRHAQESQPWHHLLELLHLHRDCAATDPRDHVYGLLGLSGDAVEIGLIPDYNQPVQEIYKELAVKHICTTKSLDIICACRGERNLVDIPSWVPDWSSNQVISCICINERFCGGDAFPGSPSTNIEKYNTSSSCCADVSFEQLSAELITKGFAFGKVVVLSPIDDGLAFQDVVSFGKSGTNGKSNSGSETFDHWLDLILDGDNYFLLERRYGNLVFEAFSKTLVANRNNKLMKPLVNNNEQGFGEDMNEDDLESMEDSDEDQKGEECSSRASEDECEDEEDTIQAFSPIHMLSMSANEFGACIQVSWGKRLALLDTGYLGIVPGHCEIGDSAYVLLGCSLPIILRAKSAAEIVSPVDHRKYVLIGESYFHGVTDGELMEEGEDGHDRNGVAKLVLI